LHPTRYRTQLCNDGSNCRRKICFFAHSLDELRVPACKPFVSPEALAAAAAAAASDADLKRKAGTVGGPASGAAAIALVQQQQQQQYVAPSMSPRYSMEAPYGGEGADSSSPDRVSHTFERMMAGPGPSAAELAITDALQGMLQRINKESRFNAQVWDCLSVRFCAPFQSRGELHVCCFSCWRRGRNVRFTQASSH
jgi:hypothetical protein